jgi:hypothetical protein
MVDGVADPSLKRKRFSPSGLASNIAQGMEAEWPRLPTVGSVHDSLARKGAPDSPNGEKLKSMMFRLQSRPLVQQLA